MCGALRVDVGREPGIEGEWERAGGSDFGEEAQIAWGVKGDIGGVAECGERASGDYGGDAGGDGESAANDFEGAVTGSGERAIAVAFDDSASGWRWWGGCGGEAGGLAGWEAVREVCVKDWEEESCGEDGW